MSLGYDQRLYILACDHRGSFQKKMFGIPGQPTAEESARISDAKAVIFEGMMKALAEGTSKESAGILIDEQFGADIARKAKAEGLRLAMPVEKSGQDEFDFDYGDDFGAHIEDFDPHFTKVLVRYNPAGDAGMNERQTARLKLLSDWLHARDRKFLFELLVPAEPAQLEAVGGDADRYDTEVRPGLMIESIAALQDAGVEPDVWKIEGIDQREDCERIVAQVRSGGRDQVSCVVLGRGANEEKVHHWLRTGAGVPGYIGFAIGRTIWWDALKGYLDGSLSREQAATEISANYRRNIEVYGSAAGAAS
jgi:myo-inositol catabolism protein IolC